MDINKAERKSRFIIVGSGWRSMYYVRVARALPDRFELTAMLCRTQEKAGKISAEYGIYTTTSISECRRMAPDFVVVAVSKDSIYDVSVEWMEYGFTVICETPAALEISKLEDLWSLYRAGKRLVVAEQYVWYPKYRAMLNVLRDGIIGEPDCMNISLAHDYHGASLMRAFLNIDAGETFSVTAGEYKFPAVETLSRYERFKDGRIKYTNRTVASFNFACKKMAWYDFDPEQYRSWIRSDYIRVQGVRGELKDDEVRFLDGDQEFRHARISTVENTVITGDANPNLNRISEIEKITLDCDDGSCRVIYEPYFGKCQLTQDETAIAVVMSKTAAYDRAVKACKRSDGCYIPTGEYSVSCDPDTDTTEIIEQAEAALRNSLQDAYMAILMKEAVKTGRTVHSGKCGWHLGSDSYKKEDKG